MIHTYLFTGQNVEENVPLDGWRSLVEDECSLLWVDVRDYDEAELNSLAAKFGLHTIALESCLDRYRRPHLYEFEDHFYVNMTTVSRQGRLGDVKPSELHVFVGSRYIITASREREASAVDAALKELKAHPNACARGSIYAFYLLMEDLVETYYPIVEEMDNQADKLEEEMLGNPERQSIKRLFTLKRSAFELRRLLGPQRDIFNELSRRDFPFITGEDQVYFQDLYSRMIRVFDMMDTIREILMGNLDIYLSTVSNRLNEVMKILTVFSIILMMLSFLTGFYGMNFTHLPWLRSPNAFRNISILMGAITLGMLWWFRRKRWI